MSIQKAKDEADQRAHGVKQRIGQVTQALNAAIERKQSKPCTVCGAHAGRTRSYAAIPTSFIATSLVLNDLDTHFSSLSLRYVWLCVDHPTYFRNLFIDAGDENVDLVRLERRAVILKAFVSGQLVVFGGAAAIKVVEGFYVDVARVKEEVERLGETATSVLDRSRLEVFGSA